MKDFGHPSNWKYPSPDSEGFHCIVDPGNSACKLTWIYRLNLKKGSSHTLNIPQQELNGVLIEGEILLHKDQEGYEIGPLDSFYLPGEMKLIVEAKRDSFLFLGGSLWEGVGEFFTRKYDLDLPLGDIHQVHGKEPYRREVFMTLAQQDKASRLICGITAGDPGLWTSWPPHQHSKYLEEVYCYFHIPKPSAAFHFASRQEGEFEFVHPVSTGDCVVVPEGYHPTCGMPGIRSTYFWVMAAHHVESRRYDLAVNDPNFSQD